MKLPSPSFLQMLIISDKGSLTDFINATALANNKSRQIKVAAIISFIAEALSSSFFAFVAAASAAIFSFNSFKLLRSCTTSSLPLRLYSAKPAAEPPLSTAVITAGTDTLNSFHKLVIFSFSALESGLSAVTASYFAHTSSKDWISSNCNFFTSSVREGSATACIERT